MKLEQILENLSLDAGNAKTLFAKAMAVKKQFYGDKIYLRALIEFSNICSKDCYYCGIRKSNLSIPRYRLTQEQIIEAASSPLALRCANVTLQSGEVENPNFADEIAKTVREIKRATQNKVRVILSCGEQTREVYKLWKEEGVNRYLLKIESSVPKLYSKLHPENHSLQRRKESLVILKELGYQVGSGMMVGLPFQTTEDIAKDLLFFKEYNIDMCGLGPYVEHSDTPLYNLKEIPSKEYRLFTSYKAIACLRLLMPDINIVPATSHDALDPKGKLTALMCGANVVMLNLTPPEERKHYKLYQREQSQLDKDITAQITELGAEIAYNDFGDALHFTKENN